ncbi:putative metalloprotease CJM1_0395 family protein [Shewanella subflava]|uniref:Metalloprotease CJM1_0395 family protein n=1 Tax=Shewanella subflava TaxID=2986476 RepID=A0ABT3I7C5_9GAMM|nr:putative metalloprotease CJM1_0395 family protein [Shewanella subflava]MCW3171951.1 putative metalloprotease CJM1_0395 family protein [Shewanella subflava]
MDIRQSSLTMNSLQPAAIQSKQVSSLIANAATQSHAASLSSVVSSANTLAANISKSAVLATPLNSNTVFSRPAVTQLNSAPIPAKVSSDPKVAAASVRAIATSSALAVSQSQSNSFNLRTGPSQIGGVNPGQIANLSGAISATTPSFTSLTEAGVSPTSTSRAINSNSSSNSLFDTTSVANPFQSRSPELDGVVEERLNPFEDTGLIDDTTQQDELPPVMQEGAKDVEAENQQSVQPQFSQTNQQSDAEKAAEHAEKQVKAQQQKQIQAEQQIISELSKRDTEVKTHEQAHKAIGGMFAQSPSYSYEKGPDGKRYAVDGEVKIDVAIVKGDPQATFNKMQKVYAAAMAPNQPSSADIRVAAEAVQKMNQAKAELAEQRQEKIVPVEDVQHINELANIYKQANVEQNGFQESQLTPFTLPDSNDAMPKMPFSVNNEADEVSTPASRFIEKMNEAVDTQSPQMPSATLAYLKNQQPESNKNLPTDDNRYQALAFSV